GIHDRDSTSILGETRDEFAGQSLLPRERPFAGTWPGWDDRRDRAEERRRAADDPSIDDGHVDRHVVATDAPHPRRTFRGGRVAEDAEPVQDGIAPRTVHAARIALDRSEDRLEGDDRRGFARATLAEGDAEHRHRRIALGLLHVT